ncbi:urease accessory protein UreD [Sphaerisporangium sp. NPDC005289]|uniref:urease accessory protein UreD n=1 Tax=Sphaerisporangium sp. NPDC005289 TaxID=3155247 RepID=UPI0033AF25BF
MHETTHPVLRPQPPGTGHHDPGARPPDTGRQRPGPRTPAADLPGPDARPPADDRPEQDARPPVTGHRRPPGARATAGRRGFEARAAVGTESSGGRTVLGTLRSDPPLTLRQTGPDTVHLVSTAAGPLGGDRLTLEIDVAAGTRLTIASVASTLVLPGDGESVMVVRARVGAGATLVYAPEPTVLAAGCDHRMIVRLTLAEGASVSWREEIAFGRYGEPPGRCHARFDATIDGVPLLRQDFVVGDPAADGSPAVYGDARCVGNILLTGPAFARPQAATASRPGEPALTPPVAGAASPSSGAEGSGAVLAEGCAVLPLAGPGTLISALAPDAPTLRSRLTWGAAQATAPFDDGD